MAVPTITSVSPALGHTGGLGLVEIHGTGFQTWVIPAPSGAPAGDDVWPTVEVLFGGAAGAEVAVVSATRLFVRVPPSPLPGISPDYGEGSVDVVVRNVDSDGVLIGSETVTLAGGYTYQRPQLADESDLGRLIRELIHELRRQTIPNVSNSNHSDYDGDTADLMNLVDVADLPAIVFFGPRIIENRFLSLNGTITSAASGVESNVRRAPDTDDLVFGFIGISDQKQEGISLQSAVRQFFKKNRWLYLQRNPSNPGLGSVKYELILDAAGIGFDPPSDQKSNLRSFSGSFVVRGFDHEELTGFAGDDVVRKISQVTEDPSVNATMKD